MGEGLPLPGKHRVSLLLIPTSGTQVSCMRSARHISGVQRYLWSQSSSLDSTEAFTEPYPPLRETERGALIPGPLLPPGSQAAGRA